MDKKPTEPKAEKPSEAQSSSANKPKTKKSPKSVMMVVAVVIVVLLAGAGFATFQSISNSPEMILKDAVEKTLAAESATFEGTLDFQAEGDENIFSGVNFSGQANNQGSAQVNVGADLLLTSVGLEVRTVDNKTYFKVEGLSELAAFFGAQAAEGSSSDSLDIAGLIGFVGAFDGRWIEVSTQALNQFGVDVAQDAQFNPEDLDKISQAFSDNMFLEVKEDLGKEDVNGVSSFHYVIGIDKDALKQFMQNLKDAQIAGVEISDEDLENANKAIDDADLSILDFEIWVSEGDRYVNKILLGGSDDEGSAKVVFTLSDFNQPVDVQAPADSKSILELINQATGNSLEGLTNFSPLPN